LFISPGSENEETNQEYRSELSSKITRWLLYESGVESEWLLNGVSSFMTRPFDGGERYQEAGGTYPEILALLEEGALPKFSSLTKEYLMSQDRFLVVRTASLDSVQYLVETYGWNQFLNFLHSHSRESTVDDAMQAALGISQKEFEKNWKNSLSSGHIAPELSDIAQDFDGESVFNFVGQMTGAEMQGRQTGSPGDQNASAYIADQFAAFGLIPAGNVEGTSYFQQFDITTTIMSTPPLLKVSGNEALDFVFRDDFSPVRAISVELNQINGEVVWVSDYEALEFGDVLSATIIIRPPTTEVDIEIEQAVNHGAVGLIFAGDAYGDMIYAKKPEIYFFPPNSPIPVFELTRSGTRKLLESSGYEVLNFSKFDPITHMGITGEMEFKLPKPSQFPTSNVLGFLPGSDPYLKNEVVIIGAHYDHVGDDPSNGLRYSGGNDNASGIGGLLEIARVWQEAGYEPKRSVLFAAWGAQELNQAGSLYYINNPIHPLENTIGLIQLDGIGGGDGFHPSVQGEWQTDGRLLLRMRTDGKLILTSKISPSDHFSFQSYPIPALLVSWRLANEDNFPDEISNKVSPERLEITGEMAILALMAIAR